MQIVIDIPEKVYNALTHIDFDAHLVVDEMRKSIANGTPLPKGHGDLIDVDRLKEEMEKDVRRAMSFVDLTDFVYLAPTIIKADKGE